MASRLREAVLAMRDNPHTLAAWSASTADARLNLLRRRRSEARLFRVSHPRIAQSLSPPRDLDRSSPASLPGDSFGLRRLLSGSCRRATMRSGFVGQNAWTGSSRPARRRSGTWTGRQDQWFEYPRPLAGRLQSPRAEEI